MATMTGQNIICFAKDWDDDPTSNTHVMRILSRDNRVLWLNSIAMRTPSLMSGTDVRRIVRRVRKAAGGPRRVHKNLWIVDPLALPLPHNPAAVAINRMVLRMTIGWLRRRLGMRDFQLWSFLPNSLEYMGSLGESLGVYYCVDNWLCAKGFDGAKLRELERSFCGRADLCFATAESLGNVLREINPETHLARHGVDHAHFAQALHPSTPVAPELEGIKPPILGVIGFIDERVDVELLDKLARANRDWSIVILGRKAVDVSGLEKHPNVRFLGRQPYERLPEFCKGFSVGLIPFNVDDYTHHVNPIKLREYLSAGLPVVSTNLPEVQLYNKLCAVTPTHDAFIDAIRFAIEDNSPARRIARSQSMRYETWENKVAELSEQVMRVKQAKRRAA